MSSIVTSGTITQMALQMHYKQFKQDDPKLLKTLIEAFPFATIAANGDESPMVAYAPIMLNGNIIEFHLAKANVVTTHMKNGTKLTILINDIGAHISPSWYKTRFSGINPDRSKTAPTYDYINANLCGCAKIMHISQLQEHLKELVDTHEPVDGWKFDEIDTDIFNKWCENIIGFYMPIESFSITTKLSQEQNIADKDGIIAGLRNRGTFSDVALAKIIEIYDGTSKSLNSALKTLVYKF